MKLDFEFKCDQLTSTNHSLLLALSSSASCQHILTICIRSCTYMDTLPSSKHGLKIARALFETPQYGEIIIAQCRAHIFKG